MMPSVENIRSVSTLGVKNVELGPFKDPPSEPARGVDGREITAVKEALEESGIRPASMHAPYNGEYDFGSLDERAREVSVGHHVRHLGYCSELGATYYVVHPGGLLYGRFDEQTKRAVWPHDHKFAEKLWNINVHVLSRLEDAAKGLGVRVCLENGWFNDPNFMTVEDFIGMVRGTGRDNVGACIDTGHANIGMGIKPADLLRRMGPLVWALHLHDNDGSGDLHLPPGRGNIDWGDVIRALTEISYKGTLDVEIPGTNYAEGVSALRSILGN
jgi:sugar phosphate isomerase/epimerase